MKRILFIAALFASTMLVSNAKAQVRFNVQLNIGSQPEWGPVGYDHVDYYYMPDIDAYYDVPSHQYVYYEGNVWVHRAYLPVRYRNYDVYRGYKVVVNRPNPWLRGAYYRNTYASYRGRGGQVIIRDSRDDRYRDHWRGGDHDNGNHNGWDRGRGNPHGDHGRGHGRGHGDHDD